MMESKTRIEDTQPIKRASRLLEEADQAMKAGDVHRAHELSLQATEAAPGYAQAWAMRTELAPSVEEKIACMNRLNELQPSQRDNHHSHFHFLKELFERDPYLAYLEETRELYHVINKDLMVLRIPKRRSITSPYPPETASALRSAYRWLSLALFGLLLAGIPTVIFAPLAARAALNVADSMDPQAGRVHSTMVELAAIVLFAIGCFFTVLFLLHLT